MKMTMQPTNHDGTPNTDRSNSQGNCDRCGELIFRFRGQGDLRCGGCDANYNAGGQRLRDDLRTRPNYSEVDDDISDMDGYEDAMVRADREWD